MRLSTKGRYATRAMLSLAHRYGKQPVPVRSIAGKQDIPGRYLEHIFTALVSAGLVLSVRGNRGGYSLARSPEKILIQDIVRATERSLLPVHCIDVPGACKRSGYCATQELWGRVKDAIDGVLGSVTLKELYDVQSRKLAKAGLLAKKL